MKRKLGWPQALAIRNANRGNSRTSIRTKLIQEDVNGEKLTVKKWCGFLVPIFSRFGADFFTVYADFSRCIRDINGEKKTSRY